jgi:organic radical activating enzyme
MELETPKRSLELALMYSHQCNIECRHCGILSGPHNKTKMPFEDAKRYILEAAAIPNFKKITFTGGEPFLFQDEHVELLALCKANNLLTRMVTNGFWARTVDAGMRVLSRMKDAGLTELNFSADKFHLEFQDPQILRNALECARQLDFARIISFVTNREDPLGQFSQMYGLPAEDVMDLREALKDVKRFDALRRDKIFVYFGGLIGLGRAEEYPEELLFFSLDIFQGGPCGEIVNKPVIYPDGDFQACCCAGGKIKSFTVGNLHKDSLLQLFKKMLGRSHFRYINSHGPRELYDIVRRARPELPRRGEYTSICEVCVRGTEGLSGDEIDAIVDAATVEQMLADLGVPLEQVPVAPRPARKSLHVIQ